MLAPIFSGEYEGVDNIILTSKYGKTKCATAKVVAGILTAILTTALIAAFTPVSYTHLDVYKRQVLLTLKNC